ncbi:hypothetical protein ACOMHN_008291 [Nucella lapillus]
MAFSTKVFLSVKAFAVSPFSRSFFLSHGDQSLDCILGGA